jgi:uncharacterized protein YuzE
MSAKRMLDAAGYAVRKLVISLSGNQSDADVSPSITSGTGAPSGTAVTGSIYLRKGQAETSSVYVYNTSGGGSWDALTNTTTAIGDDTAFTIGTDADISIEYDENGTDDLRITNGASDADIIVEDDLLVFFGNDKDVWLEYDEDGNNTGILGGTNGWRFPDSGILGFGTDGDVTITHDGTTGLDILITDNDSGALTIKQSTNNYLTFDTTNSAEVITAGVRITTTDGVASGTARVIGGKVAAITAAGTAHTGSTTEAVLASTSLPASTIKAGTVVRVRGLAKVTEDTGATTLTMRLRFGTTTLTGTALITSTATDTADNNVFPFEFTLCGRAAPGAAAAVVGFGTFAEPAAPGGAMLSAELAATNFATNGALLLELTADWSAADANSVQAEVWVVEVIG